MTLDTLGQVFNKLKKAKVGTLYVYRYSAKTQKYYMYVPHDVEYKRIFRRWMRVTNPKTNHLSSLQQTFQRRIVGFDDDDKIFVERKTL